MRCIAKPIPLIVSLALLVAFPGATGAQTQSEQQAGSQTRDVSSGEEALRLRQIDSDLWLPFMAHFEANDAESYIALRAQNFVRISAGTPRRMVDRSTYAAQTRRMFETLKQRGIRAKLEVRLQERLGTDMQAFESGVWRLVISRPDGQSMSQFGRFQVLLVRQEGMWKMLLDEDVSLNKDEGERLFEAATAIVRP